MQQYVRFVLDERIVSVGFPDPSGLKPSATILNYLRSLPFHKGVKEGCAEGDCGACTVVIAEKGVDGKLAYSAVDSCLLFLPMIHGKQLITVENLAFRKGGHVQLHPVQEQMVETDGSQCGYCTPGIVMSLFSLYKNHNNPSRDVIDDALAGNLCRCTGYRPIVEAAQKACSGDGKDRFTEKETDIIALLDRIDSSGETLELITEQQSYFKPFTLAEALRLRKEHPHAIVIGGSTDIALRQTKKKELLPEILDLSGVKELKGITETAGMFSIGSGTSMETLKTFVGSKIPALSAILEVFGSLQIRNLATIGGNIGSASPIGDLLPLLFALDAQVVLASEHEERILPVREFITGYRKTSLAPDELIKTLVFPLPGEDEILWMHKVSKRRNLDISTVSLAVFLRRDGEIIREIRLGYGGMAERTRRATETESFLTGRSWSRSNVEAAMKILDGEFTPLSDARAEKEFRTAAARNLLMKCFMETQNS